MDLSSAGRQGINIIGFATGNFGLGNTTRQFAAALLANGHPVSLFDIDAGHGRSGFDESLQRHCVERLTDLPHDLNIWVLGAPDLTRRALDICADPILQARFNAAFAWWELPDILPVWRHGAKAFDALIAGSEFVQACLSTHIPGVPVLLAPHPLDLPPPSASGRARFGLPQDQVLFFSGFEPYSDVARKNPFAAVAAFRRAFIDGSGVCLVIKVNNVTATGPAQADLEALRRLAREDARILLVEERFSYPDLLALYGCCDVFVSLHRAEGLGLVPLEAMRLGKPVVATAWSGNMSYMNHRNAALVGYGFAPPDETSRLYSPSRLGVQSKWAEPDLGHAARWMRRLAADGALRRAIGERARADALAYDERARRTTFALELESLMQERDSRDTAEYQTIAREVRAGLYEAQLQRMPLWQRAPARVRSQFQAQIDRHLLWRFRPVGK